MSRKRLSPSLTDFSNKRLTLYAIAAGAAGVGVLATAKPVTGEIVYTPASVTIDSGASLFIDLNQDGVNDFEVVNTFGHSGYSCGRLGVEGIGNGAAIVSNFGLAGKLPTGVRIGAGLDFGRQQIMAQAILGVFGCAVGYPRYGLWGGQEGANGFLGLRFSIDGQPHYGWARFSVATPQVGRSITATLHGFAYETVPGNSLKAGQTHSTSSISDSKDVGEMRPSTLGALAAGSIGVDVWRREEDPTH